MLPEFEFLSPRTIDDACRALQGSGAQPLAGGTDIIPQMRRGRLQPRCLVDLSSIPDMGCLGAIDGCIRIGALTTLAEIAASPILRSGGAVLAQAAGLVGCVQTRQRATLGGNIANASPAGDSLPALLVLDASVALAGADARRSLPLREMLLGPGCTALVPGEIICNVEFPALDPATRSVYLRLGNRQGMAIAVASVALALRLDSAGRVADARIALGSVAPTAIRCSEAEQVLHGKRPDEDAIRVAADAAAAACSPIDDVRATAAYRRRAAAVLVRRALAGLVAEPGAEAALPVVV